MTNLNSILKKQRHYFVYKRPYRQTMGFSSSHVWIWELDNKKAELQRIDAFKLWCLRILLDRESPLDSKEIKPVNAKGNHSWIFTKRTNAEAEVPILWPPDMKRQLTGKKKKKTNLMLGKIEGRRRRGQQKMKWLDDITDSMDMS